MSEFNIELAIILVQSVPLLLYWLSNLYLVRVVTAAGKIRRFAITESDFCRVLSPFSISYDFY